ncbi:GSCFA domain-containing protein [Deminuibacter soli]|uniref:GSCFA domain-containing protein n=1 Tax=Deminuibacter soli TaxID=2291815 RepID=A0A3E1NM21_9BACT|nr:GSCFA domain-containing protein [Deminuibacter soli]RFM28941.1 GSCFA domain-containing protein [Deminuibacter soli]
MQFQVPIHIKPLDPYISYSDKLLLTGSCFTEHIGNYLMDMKLQVLQNPNGILFDPISVCNSLVSYIENKQYMAADLFYLNETWHSWQHHSRFSALSQEDTLAGINQSQQQAHDFLQSADWLIITLGSSFVYKLTDAADAAINKGTGMQVANCHKAPAQAFHKHLCTIEEMITALDTTVHRLFHFNKKLRIIFTISPVRHIRDGVVENNRSKARLLETVHHLVNKFDRLYYFPAYELVIDVLRDYRFYDIDLVHPNYPATQFVLEHFTEYCMDEPSRTLMEQVRKIVLARKHKAFNPASTQHKQFLANAAAKARELVKQYPYLDFSEELQFFEAGI